MQLTSVCKICGGNITGEWFQDCWPPTIHPKCDTRPADQRSSPHPAEGEFALLAHETTLAMAEASTTPPSSPQWERFDRLCDELRQAQKRQQDLPLPVAAEAYVTELGWPVFPLKPGEKTPLTRSGFKDASSDLEQVRAWWRKWPEANIGLPTGITFDVVDVDTPIMATVWSELLAVPDFDVHGFATTSSGGYHAYVPANVVEEAKNGVGLFGPGIDFRTKGGYVVAPWSRRANGRSWQWMSFPSNTIRSTRTAEQPLPLHAN